MILAVDPGFSAKNATGMALFNDEINRLVAANVVRRLKEFDGLDAAWRIAAEVLRLVEAHVPYGRSTTTLVVEVPQIYPDERQVNPNTALLPLMGVVGSLSGMLSSHVKRVEYRPREWKGTLDGDAFISRILTRLDERERGIVDAIMPAGLRHNAIDAVGLGLRYLGRLERHRVAHVD